MEHKINWDKINKGLKMINEIDKMIIPPNIEYWRLIDGYNNYEISSHGRVRNNQTDRILGACLDGTGYYRVDLSKDGKRKNHKIHRLVADAFIPKLQNKTYVDHKDNNKLNNHMNNLRWCTIAENNRNQTKQANKSSKYKGVSWNKRNKKWRACIKHNRKMIHIGLFKDEKDAARAYDTKAKELFGKFAKLNIIN